MTFRYLPMTEQDKKEMMEAAGISSTEELFKDIPENVRFKGDLQIEPALPEPELVKYMSMLSQKNINTKEYASFWEQGCMITIRLLL